MSAGWYWARSALRRSRAGLLLAALVCVGVAGSMAAAAGARRTATADDRLLAVSAPPSAFVVAGDPGTLDAILARDEVDAATALEQFFVQPAGVRCTDASEHYFPMFVPIGDGSLTVPRPRLVAGRWADPAAAGEAVVSEQHASRLGVGVGDHIELLPGLIDEETGEPGGCGDEPVADVEVVGVIRELLELGAAGEPTLAATYLTPAFAAAHGDLSFGSLFGFGAYVHLQPGESIDAFVDSVNAAPPRTGDDEGEGSFAAAYTFDTASPLEPPLDALSGGLWALAGALALATAVAGSLGAVRQLAARAADLRGLAALGVDRRGLMVGAAALALPLVGGLALAPLIATLLSTVHLIGLARRVEPSPGLHVDGDVLVAGALIAVGLFGIVVALSAWWAATVALRPDRGDTTSRTSLVDRLVRIGAPPWVALGAGYAVEGRRARRTALPGRVAMLGVACGAMGVVAVLAFGVGVRRANDDPSVYGWGDWDVSVSADDEAAQRSEETTGLLLSDPGIDAVSEIQARFQLELDGIRLGGSPVKQLRGRAGPTVVSGRLPSGTTEIALGRATAARLGASVGSELTARGPDGTTALRVVGIVALQGFDGDSLRSGWTADRAAVDALGWGPGCNEEQECFTETNVSFRPGADPAEVVDRLAEAGFDVQHPEPGGEIVLLAQADQLPGVAAAGMALVATLGLLHAVAATVSRRRHELSVTRALGFARRHVSGVLLAESLTIGVAGAALGVVLGAALGRAAWRAVAASIGIGSGLPGVAPIAISTVAAVVLLSLLVTAWPAVRVARAKPAADLREER